MTELYRQARKSEDPEVRTRCLEMLKEVVIEREYPAEGYLGIGMQEVEAKVDGDPKPRRAIQVTTVAEESGAFKAGVEVGDLIIGLNDTVWHQAGMATGFREMIQSKRPRSEVVLKILRNGELLTVKPILGEKPIVPENWSDGNPGTTNQAAKDLFFRKWLDKMDADAR